MLRGEIEPHVSTILFDERRMTRAARIERIAAGSTGLADLREVIIHANAVQIALPVRRDRIRGAGMVSKGLNRRKMESATDLLDG